MLHDIVVETLQQLARVLFYGLCYAIGWPFVKLITLGTYPRKHGWLDDNRDGLWTSMLGLVILLVGILAVCGQF